MYCRQWVTEAGKYRVGRKALPCLTQPYLVHIWRMYKVRYFYQQKYLPLNKFLGMYLTYRYRFWLARKSVLNYVLQSSNYLRNFSITKKLRYLASPATLVSRIVAYISSFFFRKNFPPIHNILMYTFIKQDEF